MVFFVMNLEIKYLSLYKVPLRVLAAFFMDTIEFSLIKAKSSFWAGFRRFVLIFRWVI